jgi:hypothetical protein
MRVVACQLEVREFEFVDIADGGVEFHLRTTPCPGLLTTKLQEPTHRQNIRLLLNKLASDEKPP